MHPAYQFLPNHYIAVGDEVTVLIEFINDEPIFSPLQHTERYHYMDGVKSIVIFRD